MGNTPKSAMAKLAAVQAEIASVEEVTVMLRGEPVVVKPFGDWPAESYEELQAGRTRAWAEGCLTEEGLDTWLRLKPTMNEVPVFFKDYNEASGQDLGKS